MTPPHPRHVVVAAVLVAGRSVLLCHRRPDRRWYPDVWDLPGGHIRPDETPRDALARECHEELGIQVVSATPVPVVTGDPLVEMFLFTVPSWTGTPSNTAPEEHDRIAWVDRDRLDTLRLADDRYRALLTGVVDDHGR